MANNVHNVPTGVWCFHLPNTSLCPGKSVGGVKRCPDIEYPSTAFSCHLSSLPMISTCFVPGASIGHEDIGTYYIPV